MEGECGGGVWRASVEGECGGGMWRESVERGVEGKCGAGCGGGVWRRSVEGKCGGGVWRGEDVVQGYNVWGVLPEPSES